MMMTNDLFAAALGLSSPWFVQEVQFDEAKRQLTIRVDFPAGTRFAVAGHAGEHPVHDTQIKRLRHLNFFEHECYLEVRTPRVRLPDGSVRLVEPPWTGRLSGFTLLFEALVLALCREMPFAAVARIVGLSWHRVHAICTRYVELALAHMDLSDVYAIAIDETSCRRGHDYLTLVVDMAKRRVAFVTEGREAACVAQFERYLEARGGNRYAIESVSIDMSPAFIKGVEAAFPLAEITFDKFHVIAHASAAVDAMRRIEQKTDPALKGLRWVLLKDRDALTPAQRADLDALVTQAASKRTARAWLYREQLRAILERKQVNVMATLLRGWCANVMRSKVEPMKEVAAMVRRHFDGIVAWARTRQTNGLIEAVNGLFQAAKRKARGFVRFETMRTVLFLIAGKLDFSVFNPHTRQPT